MVYACSLSERRARYTREQQELDRATIEMGDAYPNFCQDDNYRAALERQRSERARIHRSIAKQGIGKEPVAPTPIQEPTPVREPVEKWQPEPMRQEQAIEIEHDRDEALQLSELELEPELEERKPEPELDPIIDFGLYNPTVGELRRAYELQRKEGNDQRRERVRELGNKLRDIWRDENNDPDGLPPPDYQNLAVDLRVKEWEKLSQRERRQPDLKRTRDRDIDIDFGFDR
jgi:hypothetical protein